MTAPPETSSKPSPETGGAVELVVAKAIEGPHDPQGIYAHDRAKLLELREHRWGRLTEQDHGVRLCEARAALAEASMPDIRAEVERAIERLEIDDGMTSKEQLATASRLRSCLAKARAS